MYCGNESIAKNVCQSRRELGLVRDNPDCPGVPAAMQYKARPVFAMTCSWRSLKNTPQNARETLHAKLRAAQIFVAQSEEVEDELEEQHRLQGTAELSSGPDGAALVAAAFVQAGQVG